MKVPYLGILFCLSASVVYADEVSLVNGDKLTGTVVRDAGDKVIFQSDVIGPVSLPKAGIRAIQSDKAVKLLDYSPASSGMVHLVADEAKNAAAEAAPAPKWEGEGKFSLGVFNNKVKSNNLSLLLGTHKKGKDDLLSFGAGWLNGKQGGVTTEKSGFISGDYNFRTSQPLYGYVKGGLQTDKVQLLDLRTILGAGVGYVWINSPDLGFRTEVGLAGVNEKYSGLGSKSKLAAQMGYKLNKKFAGNTVFLHNLSLYPKLTEFKDNYILADFSLQRPIAGRMFFDVSYITDYTGKPAAGVKKSTSKLLFNIGTKF